MSDEPMMCPRRTPGYPYADAFAGPDEWRPPRLDPDHPGLLGNTVRTCSFCGSMHPDDVMAGLADRSLEAGPTDKGYKLYLHRPATDADRERAAKSDVLAGLPVSGASVGKFYFPHLSAEQRTQFIEMLNAGTMLIGYPGHFYQLPYFAKVAT